MKDSLAHPSDVQVKTNTRTTFVSGQRTVLFGISKRRDRYLRTLPIHGACAAARVAGRKCDARNISLSQLG